MKLESYFPLTVPDGTESDRADRMLALLLPDLTRARWAKLIDQGLFKIGDKTIKTSSQLSAGMTIVCDAKRLGETEGHESLSDKNFEGVAPEVVYKDSDILVINKPDGLTVHPGAGTPLKTTVVAWLLSQGFLDATSEDWVEWNDDVIEDKRPGIVHRLDKGTSGLMVVALNPTVHADLSEQFASREASRVYEAVVSGNPSNLRVNRPQALEDLLLKRPSVVALKVGDDFSFAASLERDPSHRTRFRVGATSAGKHSLTHFKIIKSHEAHSLLELKLDTGRTHQIRVHMSFLGYPIVGDDTYGGRGDRRLWLHAKSLSLRHPKTGKVMSWSVPWPDRDAREIREWGL